MGPKPLRLRRSDKKKEVLSSPNVVKEPEKKVQIVVVKRTAKELLMDKIKAQTAVVRAAQDELDVYMNQLNALNNESVNKKEEDGSEDTEYDFL